MVSISVVDLCLDDDFGDNVCTELELGGLILAESVKIGQVRFAEVKVTDSTTWTFAEVYSLDGLCSVVEITCGGSTAEAVRLMAEMVEQLNGIDIADESDVEGLLGLAVDDIQANIALAASVSGIRSAVSDLQAQMQGITLTEALGGVWQESVPLYANINRHLMTQDRTPAAFGRAADLAVSNGFTTIKCAPFDGVAPPSTKEAVLDIARAGIERVAALREAVGPDIEVLVDCHSRFERHTAPLVAERLAMSDIGWFEEPLEPTSDPDGLADVASQVSMTVAGGESGYSRHFFRALVESGAVDVVMPDVKYCGGVAEACAAGRAAMGAGGNVSLHSPSGPVSLIAGGHATAAMPGSLYLEHAVYEADWRAEVVLPHEVVRDGRLWMPKGSGLGATLNEKAISQYGRWWKQ